MKMDKMQQFLTILLLGCILSAYGAAVPKAEQTLQLSPGWNLVALEGTPLRMQEFLELRPMVFEEATRSYTRVTESTVLRRGTAVWIHSEKVNEEKIPLVAASAAESEAISADDGWSLVGAASDRPSWLEQVTPPFFRWEPKRGFVPTSTPTSGQGYWVKKTE